MNSALPLLPIMDLSHDAQSFDPKYSSTQKGSKPLRGKSAAKAGSLSLPIDLMSPPHPTLPQVWLHTSDGRFERFARQIGRLNDKRKWPSLNKRIEGAIDLLDVMARQFALVPVGSTEPDLVFVGLRLGLKRLFKAAVVPGNGVAMIACDKAEAEATLDQLERARVRFKTTTPDWTSAFINAFATVMADIVKLMLDEAKAMSIPSVDRSRNSAGVNMPAKEVI